MREKCTRDLRVRKGIGAREKGRGCRPLSCSGRCPSEGEYRVLAAGLGARTRCARARDGRRRVETTDARRTHARTSRTALMTSSPIDFFSFWRALRTQSLGIASISLSPRVITSATRSTTAPRRTVSGDHAYYRNSPPPSLICLIRRLHLARLGRTRSASATLGRLRARSPRGWRRVTSSPNATGLGCTAGCWTRYVRP